MNSGADEIAWKNYEQSCYIMRGLEEQLEYTVGRNQFIGTQRSAFLYFQRKRFTPKRFKAVIEP
jgi:hypothetical protein